MKPRDTLHLAIIRPLGWGGFLHTSGITSLEEVADRASDLWFVRPRTRAHKMLRVHLRKELTALVRRRSIREWMLRNYDGRVNYLLRLALKRSEFRRFQEDSFEKARQILRRSANKPTTRVRAISVPWAEVFFTSNKLDHAYTVVQRGETRAICKSLQDAYRFMMNLACQTTDPKADDNLGLRYFNVDIHGILRSPIQGTEWKSRFLRADNFPRSEAVECQAGIHAKRLPYKWRDRIWECAHFYLQADTWNSVIGLVRRHGAAVIGNQGWRAEGAEILELWTPSERIATKLLLRYPGAAVHFVPSR